MKYYFPPQNQTFRYLQTNRSDILGSLWSSFNLDFQTNLGQLRLSQKLVTNTTSSDDADLGIPCAFEFFDNRWWSIAGTRVFKNSSELLTAAFTEDASTGAQTDYDTQKSDLAVFNNRMWSTTADNLYSKASGSGTGDWTSRDALGTAIHKLAYFKKHNRLYYVDSAEKISSIDSADVVSNVAGDYFIDLGLNVSNSISTIVASSEYIWIGIRSLAVNSSGFRNESSIMQWDGISSQITKEFKLDSAGCLAMTIINDIPYAMDSEGRVLKFNGYSFQEIARLPVDKILLLKATDAGSGGLFIHYNGMIATKNNTILFLINNTNGDNGATVNENLPSGVWELDLTTNNFTHKYSPSLKANSSSTITDFGQNRILSAGALKINKFNSDSTSGKSTLICGFGYYTDATTTKYGIFIDSPAGAATDNEGQKRGYFVTTWFNTSELIELWQKISETHRLFLNSADKIIFKYRTTEETPVYATITWVDTTHFTTTTNIAAYGPTQTPFDGSIGGEVEVLQGSGAGACVHITNISLNAGTYTVTVDNAVTGVTTGTAKARFQKWRKIIPEITGQVDEYSQRNIDKATARIQIKGVLEFTGDDEFHKFIISSQNHIKLEG